MDPISILSSNILATLLIIGGIFGFITAKSVISLTVGLISGLLIFVACKKGITRVKESYLFIAAISLVLAILFAIKFSSSPVLLPNGLMLILSTTNLAIVGLSYLKLKKK